MLSQIFSIAADKKPTVKFDNKNMGSALAVMYKIEVFTTLNEICHQWFCQEYRHILTFRVVIGIMLISTFSSSWQ